MIFYLHFLTSLLSSRYSECTIANIYDNVNNQAHDKVTHIQILTYLQLILKSSVSWWFNRLFVFGLVFLKKTMMKITGKWFIVDKNRSMALTIITIKFTFGLFVFFGIQLLVILNPIEILNHPIIATIEMIQHCYCVGFAYFFFLFLIVS